ALPGTAVMARGDGEGAVGAGVRGLQRQDARGDRRAEAGDARRALDRLGRRRVEARALRRCRAGGALGSMSERVRVDVWIWAVRLVKTRAAATEACRGGHVKLGG